MCRYVYVCVFLCVYIYMYRYMFGICIHLYIYIYMIMHLYYILYILVIYIIVVYLITHTHTDIYIYIHIRDFAVILYLFFFVFKDILAFQLTFPIFPSWFQHVSAQWCIVPGPRTCLTGWGDTERFMMFAMVFPVLALWVLLAWAISHYFPIKRRGCDCQGRPVKIQRDVTGCPGNLVFHNFYTIGERLPWSEVIGFGRGTLKFSPELRYVASSSFFEEFREELWCLILPG